MIIDTNLPLVLWFLREPPGSALDYEVNHTRVVVARGLAETIVVSWFRRRVLGRRSLRTVELASLLVRALL
jgi:hypothetical protein